MSDPLDPGKLLDGFLDDELTLEQNEELQAWLAADPRNVQAFVREIHLHCQLTDVFGGQEQRAVLAAQTLQQQAGSSGANKIAEVLTTFPTPKYAYPLWRRRLAQAIAVAACITFGIVQFFYKYGQTPGGAPPPFAEIARSSGEVRLYRNKLFSSALTGTAIQRGDEIRLDTSSHARIAYADGSILEVAGGSCVQFEEHAGAKQVLLKRGTLTLSADQQPARQQAWVIHTPSGNFSIAESEFELSVDRGETVLRVNEGRIRFGGKYEKLAMAD